MKRMNRALLAALLTHALAACAHPPPALTPPAAAAPGAEIERARAELMQAVGEPRCSADTQCRSLGVGARPCGGPQSYVAVSTLNTDAAVLERLALRHRELVRAEQRQSGRVGTCQVLPDPGAQCGAAGLCVLGSVTR
ncbi:putative small lipoprotein YifL [Inhella inkyongensis]|uniref:Putative small lipoprotein YifL n=1 Tax=Inhella inkyongensis TaxID=392593 RepID=A0A840S7Q7_9BURK|nr:hypothetical protein [Inhella inkyongensis]MBB5205703.1 putative small lipoprotein YifL [Inhella inkyongensis]